MSMQSNSIDWIRQLLVFTSPEINAMNSTVTFNEVDLLEEYHKDIPLEWVQLLLENGANVNEKDFGNKKF